nr:MAG: DNA pilot protein [Microvirus sp.]
MAFDWTGLAAAGVGAGSNMWEGWRNREFQRDVNEQNEALMRESWARDDTAVQRSAADFEAAGLSKTLAAGNSAGNSGPIHLESLKSNASNVAQGAMQALMTRKSIAQSNADIELTKATKDGKDLDNKLKAEVLDTEIQKKKVDLNTKVQDLALKISNMQAAEIEAQARANKAAADALKASYGSEAARLENLQKQYEIEIIQKTGLDAAKAKVAAQQLANEMFEWEMNFYKASGLPKGGNLFEQIIRGFKGEVNPY